ncbi:RNA-guided endonuclease InsQ/TnpB family protein [Paenibacillus beijingensis]|uniref:RNA-guided endonuclease InsQ/TnpB family protein n=1 Tax=Paenibacillus beijingensis TaxID=1126833 RepID=UPI003B75D31A
MLFRGSTGTKQIRKTRLWISRKPKGSRNRHTAKQRVAKTHQKVARQRVARQRKDFLHKQSYRMVRDHDLIAVENLKVRNRVRNRRLAKSISSAGWRRFMTYLGYKAEKQGKRFVQVPAHGTSQTCLCGADVSKSLAVRIHECRTCGLIQDRDIVSAKLILQRALEMSA